MAFPSRLAPADNPTPLLGQIEEVLHHSLQKRRSLLLLVVAPVVFTVVVVLVSRILPLSTAIPVAVIATIPGTAIAWCSGVLASRSLDQGSKTLGQIIRAQLRKRRRVALFEPGLPLYVDWYITLRLNEELQRSHRYGCPTSLLMLAQGQDVSYDPAGLAEALRHRLRSSDLAGAMLDDQVIIVLPNSGLQQARRARQRLRPIATRFGYAIGVATSKGETTDYEAFIQAALDDLCNRQSRKREQKLAA